MNKLKLLRKKVKKSNLKNFKEVKVKSVSLKKPLGFEKKRTFYFKEFNVLRKKNKFVLLNQKIVKNNIKNFKRLSNIIIFNKLSTKKKFKKLYNLHTLYNQNIKGKVFTRFNRKKYLRPFFVGRHNKRILKFFEKNPRRWFHKFTVIKRRRKNFIRFFFSEFSKKYYLNRLLFQNYRESVKRFKWSRKKKKKISYIFWKWYNLKKKKIYDLKLGKIRWWNVKKKRLYKKSRFKKISDVISFSKSKFKYNQFGYSFFYNKKYNQMRRFYKIVKNKKILKKNKNLKRILFRCNNKQIYKYSFKIKKKKEKRYYRRFYIPVYRNPYQLKDVRSLLKKFKENKKFSLINFFKLYYNFSTKNQLFRFVKNCKSTVKFFKRFEHRYDVLLYRLNFTNSFYESKLLIKNGYFCLNNQVMTNYRLSLNKLDIVSPSNNFFVCIYNQLLIKFLYYSKCL